MKYRLIAFLIAIITVFSLAACENVEYPNEQSSSVPDKIDIYEKLESELPDLETSEGEVLEERDFKIISDDASIFYNDEQTPASIKTAVEKRNAFLKSKYGANIVSVGMKSSEITSELKSALESGVQFCDLIAVSAKNTTKLYTAGLLYNMNNLPNFNPESSYFDARNALSLATNNTLYMIPDPSAFIYEETYVLFYNRELLSNAGCEDPETLVMQGKWTWDAFDASVKRAAAAVISKTSADINLDTFGFGAYYTEDTQPLVMWTSTGNKVIENTYKNPVDFSMEVDEILPVVQRLRSSYNSKAKFPLEGNDAAKAFEEGRIAFFVNKLDYLYGLRDGSLNGSQFGILPMPKYSEEQTDYYCLNSTDSRLFSVPKTLENADDSHKKFVSVMLSGICAAGGTTVKESYLNYHVALYLNNNAETVMFKTIIDSATFDFSNVYGSTISEIRRPTSDAVADYIDFGSALNTSISNSISRFREYVNTNFN